MSQSYGLTKQELHWALKALRSSVDVRLNIELWDRNRGHRATIKWQPQQGMDGQIDLNTSSPINWSAQVSIPDPDGRLHFDSNALFADRLLRIEQLPYVPELGRRVTMPAFTGPCNAPTVHGAMLSVEAQGMEMWACGNPHHVVTIKKDTNVSDAIRRLMVLAGEEAKYLDVPFRVGKLPADYTLAPDDDDGYWGAVRYLAQSIHCNAFYDVFGVFHLRPMRTHTAFTFEDGPDGTILEAPEQGMLIGSPGGADLLSLYNHIILLGKTTQNSDGDDVQIKAEAFAAKGSRFYEKSIGHPGPGLLLTKTVENSHVAEQDTADRMVGFMLDRSLATADAVKMLTSPVPHLDPYDDCQWQMHSQGTSGSFDYGNASMPLIFSRSNPQTVGFNDLVSVPPQGPRGRRR